jgi:nicotinate-nucleotide adenylyltransferase
MPTFLNPFKSAFTAPAQLRLAWLREIFKPYEDVIVSSFEVDLGTKTPTITTVEYLLESYEKVYLVIGADNLASLESWHRFSELKEKVTFIVASRDETEIPSQYIKLPIDIAVSSTLLRNEINIEQLPKRLAGEIAHFYKDKNAK